ncbi:hypothetical protein [Polaromonas sp. YR568]|uniref:hypothetical protein n=1 Tax=Polaromonas sp. YR568 TaxID=1855301 RepID=UPI003137CBAA
MFITREAHRSPLSSLFLDDGETGWLSTELALQKIWFLVEVEESDCAIDFEFSRNRTVLVFDFRGVEQLILSKENSTIQLKSVYMFTPGHVNGSNSWNMDQLRAVWHGREPVGQDAVPMDIFETVSGKKYPASFSALSIEDLVTGALKFEMPH